MNETPKRRVLIIDSHQDWLLMQWQSLPVHDYDVRPANGPAEAEPILNSQTFDLFIVDPQFDNNPGKPGEDFVVSLMRRFPNTPLLISTSNPDSLDFPDHANVPLMIKGQWNNQ